MATKSTDSVSMVGRTAAASPTRSSTPDGSNGRGPPGIGGAEVGEQRAGAIALGRQVAHDIGVDRGPARLELDADRPARPAGDGRAEERPADAGERVEHELAGLGEELDQAGHQARRLVRPVRPARGVPELRRVGRRQQRLGEVQPLLAGQLVERVGRVWRAAAVGHRGQPSRRRRSEGLGR